MLRSAQILATSLNDLGRLGILARAMLQSHLRWSTPTRAGVTSDLCQPKPTWVRNNFYMQLRQAAIVHDSDLRIRYGPALTPDAYMLYLYELTTYMVAAKAIPAPLPCLQSSVLLPL